MLARIFTLFFSIVSSLSLSATDPVILQSESKSTLHFYYHDSLGYGHPVTALYGETKVYLNSPVLLFEADRSQTPYLVYPGERLTIQKEDNESARLSISSNQKRTNELLFFRMLVKQTGGIYMTFPLHDYQGKARDLLQFYRFENEINTVKVDRVAFLDSFLIRLPVTPNFKKTASEVIFSTAIKDTLLLLWNNRNLLKTENLYDIALRNLIKTINSKTYSPFMPGLLAALLPVNINNNSLEFFVNTQQTFKTSFNFIESEFSGMAKSFLLARLIVAALSNKLLVSSQYLQKFYSSCTDGVYTVLVNNKLADMQIEEHAKGSNTLLDLDKSKTDLNALIKSYPGKLIYIDFWASWCSPCRAEMPSSRKIRKLFDKEEIVFLYVSIDTGIADWVTANAEEGLSKKKSFLLLNSATSPFVKQYKIQSIPRYLLIGKNGQVLSANAPRPSDPALIKMIKKYL